MRGQIINRNGHYAVVISYKDPLTGKWQKKWTAAGDSKRQAEKLRTKLLTDAAGGIITKPGRVTLGEHLKTWLASPSIRTLAPRTLENYEYNINKYILPRLSHVTLAALTDKHVSDLESDILGTDGSMIRTVQMIHSILHKSLDLAVKKNLAGRNVVDMVAAPKKDRREMQILTEKEIILVLEMARDTTFYPILHLALFCGLRRGELLALRWGDVDFTLGTLSVQRGISRIRYGVAKGQTIAKSPKTPKGKRLVPLPESAIETLHEHYEKTVQIRKALDLPIADNDYVFSSHYLGEPFDPCSITRSFKRLAKKVGISDVSLHGLRHTFATMLIKNGVHPKVVSELLGHASTAITMDLYSHVSPTMQRDAVSKIDSLIFGSR